MNKKITLVIMSAGNSERFRQKIQVKKHWLRIENKPLWLYVADKIQNRYNFAKVIITSSKQDMKYMKKFCPYDIVEGGYSRQDSLNNALKNIDSEFVAVSDAARFRLDFDVLDRLFDYNLDNIDCLVPVLGVKDTIFLENNGDKNYLNRESIRLIQTPQISRVSVLKEALKLGNFSDESSAINEYGGKVATIEGSKILDKLTYLDDIKVGELTKSSDVFVGYGFDVHKFANDKKMFLGGVFIDCNFGVEAHSDGDVVLHSLCDALLGAIGAGDIGEWFPNNDDKYKGISSNILLKEVVDFIFSVGFKITNVDIMIMAQKPNISSYKDLMLDNLSNILRLQKNYINIKATTMEKMGFIGREEGICSSANVSLRINSIVT